MTLYTYEDPYWFGVEAKGQGKSRVAFRSWTDLAYIAVSLFCYF